MAETHQGKPCTYCGGTERFKNRHCIHAGRKDHTGSMESRRRYDDSIKRYVSRRKRLLAKSQGANLDQLEQIKKEIEKLYGRRD